MRNSLLATAQIIAFSALVGCATVEGDWRAARERDTDFGYYMFLDKHPDSQFADEAKKRREDLKRAEAEAENATQWAEAKARNTRRAYERFISRRPNSRHVEEARFRIEAVDWSSAKTVGSVEAYATFIKLHPDSQRAAEAQRLSEGAEFAAAVESKMARGLAAYLKAYPTGTYYKEALRHIQKNEKTHVDDARGIIAEIYEFGTTDHLTILKHHVLTADGSKPVYDSIPAPAGTSYVIGTVNIYLYKGPLSISQDDIVVEGDEGLSKFKSWKFLDAWLAERLFGSSKSDDRKIVTFDDEERIAFMLEFPTTGLDSALLKVVGIPLGTVGSLK